MNKKKINKSSVTGRFVSREEMAESPDTTYTQTVEVKPKPASEPEKLKENECENDSTN